MMTATTGIGTETETGIGTEIEMVEVVEGTETGIATGTGIETGKTTAVGLCRTLRIYLQVLAQTATRLPLQVLHRIELVLLLCHLRHLTTLLQTHSPKHRQTSSLK